MTTVYVNTISDLINNWNGGLGGGNGQFIIQNNLTISQTNANSFPLQYSSAIDTSVSGVLQASPYIITVDVSNNTQWNGVFRFTQSTNRMTILNLQLTIQSGILSTLSSAWFKNNAARNPIVTMENIQVSLSPIVANHIVYNEK